MTTEVIKKIGIAETRLRHSDEPQKIKRLKFELPNDLGLNGTFEAELVGAEGVDAVDLRLRGQGEPFVASITRTLLLSDAVTLAPSGARTTIERLIQKIRPPSSTTSPISVGRTRY